MDKELAKLQKEIIKRLIEYEDELTALNKPNALKKTKRVAGSAAWNIAAFPDLVQNLLDSGIPTSQIVTKLKYFQEKLLKDVEQIKGTETGHHNVGLRTGGSFYRADPEIWQPTVSRLADFFEAEFGDTLPNIRSLLNWTHKSDTNVKGIEKALNIGANPFKEFTAHPLGTASKFISGELSPKILSDPDKLFNALAARIDQQLQAAEIASTVQQPLEQAVQTFAPKAYRAPTIEASKQVQTLTALPENRLIIEQGILETVGGSTRLNQEALRDLIQNRLMARRALTGFAAAGLAAPAFLGTAASGAEFAGRSQLAQQTGDFADQAQAGLAGVSLAADVASYFPPAAPIGEAVSTTADVANIGIDLYREDPERAKKFARETISKAVPKPPVVQQVQQVQRAAQAVQRGGKVKFKAGKVQFTLPEFGLSELLGFN